MKRSIVSALLIAALFIGCAAEGGREGEERMYRKITAAQAKERMEQNPYAVVLDVRTRQEYEAGHIAGAVLLPRETIGENPPEQLPDKDAEILVYCRTGNRSAKAANKLAALGYANVSDFGGIADWPYGTVKG